MENLLKSFKKVRWGVAARTYGNDHATLIGLIVSCWNGLSKKNWAVENGPLVWKISAGKRGVCDAILCDSKGPAVVLEVEGSRFKFTLKKIAKALISPLTHLKNIRAGVMVAYGYDPRGYGKERKAEIHLDQLLKILGKLPAIPDHKKIFLILIDKGYERKVSGVRGLNEYYRCFVSKVTGYEITNKNYIKGGKGKVFWPEQKSSKL